MKINKKVFVGAALVVLMIAAFFVGKYVAEQENKTTRAQICHSLIVFAIDKVGQGAFEDQDTMEALVSNIYAAYQFCDDQYLAGNLHDLWNALIFEDEALVASEDVLIGQLESYLERLKMDN